MSLPTQRGKNIVYPFELSWVRLNLSWTLSSVDISCVSLHYRKMMSVKIWVPESCPYLPYSSEKKNPKCQTDRLPHTWLWICSNIPWPYTSVQTFSLKTEPGRTASVWSWEYTSKSVPSPNSPEEESEPEAQKLGAFYQLPYFSKCVPYLTFSGHMWKSQVYPFYCGKHLLLKNLIADILYSTSIVWTVETVEQLVNRCPFTLTQVLLFTSLLLTFQSPNQRLWLLLCVKVCTATKMTLKQPRLPTKALTNSYREGVWI